jgi:hypothetical protein
MVTGISATREWFRKVLKKLPEGQASLIFGVGYAHLKTWSTDLNTSEHIHYNPLERLTGIIQALQSLKIQMRKDASIDDPEAMELAEWPAHYFCNLTNHTAESTADVIPDKPTWELEALDDAPALGEYQQTLLNYMDGHVDEHILRAAEENLRHEITQTTIKAIADRSARTGKALKIANR